MVTERDVSASGDIRYQRFQIFFDSFRASGQLHFIDPAHDSQLSLILIQQFAGMITPTMEAKELRCVWSVVDLLNFTVYQ